MARTGQFDTPPSRHDNPLKKPLVITGLLLFFGFDELLLIFLFFKIGFPRLPALTWVTIALAATALNLGLALVVYRVIMKRPSTGVEGLVGLTGTVEVSHGKRGTVYVRGERWDADFLEDANVGDEVRVVSVRGLRLAVERTGTGADVRRDPGL
jgi:membrane protein implicated in regulation of membrane protease activity